MKWQLVVSLVLLSLATGCADPNEATLGGTVTIDGQSAKEGSIAFFPIDGESRTTGAKIVDGKYNAAVPLGKTRIEIRVPKVVGQRKLYDTPNSETQPILQEVLPAKYNNQSELQLEIKPGKNEKNFELTTK
jgi:hypothetical protein